MLLRPPVGAVPFLSVARVSLAAVAAARSVAGVAAGLKWPNDVVVRGPSGARKLAGVLAEVDRDAIVVGIGMNIGWAPEGAACLLDLASSAGAGSTHAAAPTATTRDAVFDVAPAAATRDAVLDALLRSLDDWLVADDRMVMRAYRESCVTLGLPVRVELTIGTADVPPIVDDAFTGIATDITDTGALLVDTGTHLREVSTADIVHLR